MNFKITILGNGSALPASGSHHSGQAVNVHEQHYLIDCGEGTQTRLYKYGVNPLKIRAIFLSHMHGDHVYGLMPLLSTLALSGKKTPLPIYGPDALGRLLEFYREFFQHEESYGIQFHPVDTTRSEMIYENKVLEVWSVPLRHRTPSTGYLFREKEPELNVHKNAIARYGLGIAQIVAAKSGRSVTLDDGQTLSPEELTYVPYSPRSYAYLSDTLYSGKAVKVVEGVDMLYHEATFLDIDKPLAKATGHSTAAEAARAASTAGAGRLLIGHFSGRYKDKELLLGEARELFPCTEIAREGETYSLPLKKTDIAAGE